MAPRSNSSLILPCIRAPDAFCQALEQAEGYQKCRLTHPCGAPSHRCEYFSRRLWHTTSRARPPPAENGSIGQAHAIRQPTGRKEMLTMEHRQQLEAELSAEERSIASLARRLKAGVLCSIIVGLVWIAGSVEPLDNAQQAAAVTTASASAQDGASR